MCVTVAAAAADELPGRRSTDMPTQSELTSTGADPTVVGPFLASRLHDQSWLDCTVRHISGGMSNLTYIVHSAAGELVLRRPPLGNVLPTAHDMGREYRVMTALAQTEVPAPRTMLTAEAGEDLDFSCVVMERVVGHVCRDSLPAGYADDPAERRAIGHALVDVLAALHSLDPIAVGLEDFGRPEGFMSRQLRRWSKQWDASKTEDMPALERLRDALEGSLPGVLQPATLVHGDYRLDNTVLHPADPSRIVAVLDWELSTLGDPLSDLGALLAYWAQADDDEIMVAARIVPPITADAGFPTRAEVVSRYAERTGFDLSDLDWYVAFAYFKVAVICQGIAARNAAGAMIGEGFDKAAAVVAPLIDAGLRAIESKEVAL